MTTGICRVIFAACRAQAEVAAALGVSQSPIPQIENGELEAMGLETLRAYAAAPRGPHRRSDQRRAAVD
jgi:predicted XRE-type DNA-binding protein